mmetsp:Transcript_14141/g.17987  ORF Transcript_14141/g.17987 Transcript_14141/m.17987 type:complete len:86 (+) Transcript_14141:255-512(+)
MKNKIAVKGQHYQWASLPNGHAVDADAKIYSQWKVLTKTRMPEISVVKVTRSHLCFRREFLGDVCIGDCLALLDFEELLTSPSRH